MRDFLEKVNLALRSEGAESNEHDFPDGAVDKNRPASAEGTDSIPSLEGFTYQEQLTSCATAVEPVF